MKIDNLVLVTGAEGFVASHIIQRLLHNGYRVRGTVRPCTSDETIDAIHNLAPQAQHKLELVVADLCHDEGWDQAVSGCWAVMHVASPVPAVKKELSDEEYIEPALHGTRRVLRAAANAAVKKFIFTSAFSAVLGAPMPFPKDKMLTEEDWTDLDFPNLEVYTKSKTLAERAVWDFVENMPENERFDVTVLVPTGTVGPPLLKPSFLTGTLEYMNLIFTRVYPGLPNLNLPFCDVRDVAEAHVKALTTPKATGQRIIIHTDSIWLPEMSKILSNEFKPQGYYIYTHAIPSFILWLPTFFDKRFAATGLVNKVGQALHASNEKMKRVLGIHPRPLSDSVLDMAYGMIDLDIMFREKKYRQAGSRMQSIVEQQQTRALAC